MLLFSLLIGRSHSVNLKSFAANVPPTSEGSTSNLWCTESGFPSYQAPAGAIVRHHKDVAPRRLDGSRQGIDIGFMR